MDCQLPATGLNGLATLVIAVGLVVAGAAIALTARRHLDRTAAVVLAALAVSIGVIPFADAAASTGCPPGATVPPTTAGPAGGSSVPAPTMAEPPRSTGPATTSAATTVPPTSVPTTTIGATTSTSTTSTTSSTSTSTTSTSTTSTSTSTTIAPRPPIARPDEVTVALGGQQDVYYFANDDLFGLAVAFGTRWEIGSCSGRVLAEPNVVQDGFATLHGQVLGDCVMNYTVATSAGSASSTITIHVVPLP